MMAQSQQPTSLEPFAPQKDYAPEKKRLRASDEVTREQQVEAFYKRKKLVEKARMKYEKEMLKPQYSDPSYFGHKRPPKKRPVGKRKFCKVCELVH